MGFLNPDNRDLGELEEEKEKEKDRMEIAQMKAIEEKAKKRYGSNWKEMLGGVKSGLDWDAVKFQLD
jgi:hypothetical protein